jgi:hypothetical protein
MGNDTISGREPRKLDDLDAWKEAVIKGGGLGVFSDALVYGENSEGKDIFNAMLGPLVDSAAQAYTAGAAAIDQVGDMATGQETDSNAGQEFIKLLKKVTPFTTTWYTKLATERMIWDNLQRLADPDADAAFERRRQWYEENKQQQYWWAPGQAEPDLSRLTE